MDNTVRPTIQKIKLQEQDNEAKLKEKRELNATIAKISRGIHDTTMNIEKLSKEQQTLIATTERLEQQLIIEKSKQSALFDQVNSSRKELDELQKKSISGVTSVWEKRSKLFETIHYVADKCDIWALLTKPTYEISPNVVQVESNAHNIIIDDTKIKAALDRKNNAIAKRNILLNEPEVGEEFVRTRNAIQYSMDMMAVD